MEEEKIIPKLDFDAYFEKVWSNLKDIDIKTEEGKKEFTRSIFKQFFEIFNNTDELGKILIELIEDNQANIKNLEELVEEITKRTTEKQDYFSKLLEAQGELAKSASDAAKLTLEILMKPNRR